MVGISVGSIIKIPCYLLGIPLIFKDSNLKIEAAGQTEEDEIALNRNPLLFSFNNSNRDRTCQMRVGTGLYIHQNGSSQWSQRFSLEQGSTYRQVQVRSSRTSTNWNYSISIDIRPGNGHMKRTKFIFLNARYILYNHCSYDLLIAQRHAVDNNTESLQVLKHTNIAYHWPRTDTDQLLCIRVVDEQKHPLVHWSGGFSIDSINAFHINMRYENGQCLILYVQVTKRNSTYFVVFEDSDRMPIPFRIRNRSDVPIEFYQNETKEDLTFLRSVILPDHSFDYALDEPTLKPTITCSVTDGRKATYNLLRLGSAEDLHYENYIFLALQETFDSQDLRELSNTTDVSSHQLIIEYQNDRLFLAKYQENRSSQLWQMTNNGLLIHVGSSSSQNLNTKKEQFVLDIEDLHNIDLSNLMEHFTRLIVRPYDPKRAFTQTWQFLDNGYLCMKNTQLCIQVFGELKENNDVVLGSIE